MTGRFDSEGFSTDYCLLFPHQLDVEDELLAGEGVVAVDGDVGVGDFGDDDLYLAAVLEREREVSSDLRLLGELRRLARDLRDEAVAAGAVGVLRLYLDRPAVADVHPAHRVVE